ncbi:hypothetical protein M885DRAFT_569206 [Pelagophyceae sp. CCMP2097]|nr:hypothetical protein M885DRAFT_569206 [Pelagophyceae sp. CCMP2097]
MPRTASTFLHRLLASDAATRSPLLWEQDHNDFDVRPAKAGELLTDRRIDVVKNAVYAIRLFSPNIIAEFFKFHVVGATDAEECTPFLRRYYWEMEAVGMSATSLAKREAWLEDPKVDKNFVAQELKAWLALHSDATAGVAGVAAGVEGGVGDSAGLSDGVSVARVRWVLKAPMFTHFLRELAQTFPDGLFVFTNRDVLDVIPSMCGLAECLASIKLDYSDLSLLNKIGAVYVKRIAAYARAQLDFFQDAPVGLLRKPLYLRYKDVLADPALTLKGIYTAADLDWTPAVDAAVAEQLTAAPQHQHGKPSYSLKKFGIDAKAVPTEFHTFAKTFL